MLESMPVESVIYLVAALAPAGSARDLLAEGMSTGRQGLRPRQAVEKRAGGHANGRQGNSNPRGEGGARRSRLSPGHRTRIFRFLQLVGPFHFSWARSRWFNWAKRGPTGSAYQDYQAPFRARTGVSGRALE